MNPLRCRLAIAVAMSLALGIVFTISSAALAFTGPTSGQAAGTGSGALGVGANQDVSVGTSTASTNTKLLIQASSTNDTSNYVFKVIDSSQNPLFIIRNDGTIGVDTSNLSGGTLNVNGLVSSENGFTGSVSAANVTAGTFGNNYGGGTFSFPDAVCIGFSGCGDLLSVRAAGSWTGEGNTTASFGAATAGTDSVALQTRNSNGSDLLTVFGNGMVGINGFGYPSPVPVNYLDVNGNEAIGSYAGHDAAPTDGLIVSGNVGIGTTNPGMSLEVQKDQHGYTGVRVTNTDMTSGDYGTQAGYWISGTASDVSIGALKWVPQLLGGTGALYLTTESNYPLAFGLDSSPTPAMVINTNGNVGIGTTAPSNALEIGGSNQAIQVDYNGGPSYAGELRWAGLQLGNNGANRIVAGRSSPGGNLVFYTNNTNDAANYNVAPDGTLALMLNASGSAQFYQNVTVSGNLTVDGTFGGQALTGTLSAANVSAGTFGSNTGGGTYVFPAMLEDTATNGQEAMLVTGYSTSTGYSEYVGNWASSGWWGIGPQSGSANNTVEIGNVSGGGAWSSTQNLNLVVGGDVGIGTTAPAYALDVSGGIRSTGNSYLGGSLGIGNSNEIWGTASNGTLWINYRSYDGGTTAGATTYIGNGKGSAVLTVTPNSNVGIGTGSPSAELSVSPSGGDWNEGIDINPAPDNYDGLYLRQTSGSITGSWFVGKENNGNFGILRNGLTGMGTVSRVDAPLEISSSTGAAIFGGNLTVNSNAQINGDIIPSASSNTGGSNWIFGSGVWGGTVSGDDSVTGIEYAGGSGSQLFTLSSNPGQASMEMDGSLFLGDGAPSYNPYSLTAASDGELAVNGNTEIGGSLNVQGSITSGGFTGTLSAANVSAGTFGSNTGGGNYTFPGTVTASNLYLPNNTWFDQGDGDGANFSTVDASIKSWWGIGFSSTCGAGNCGLNPNNYTVVIDPRVGNLYTQGGIRHRDGECLHSAHHWFCMGQHRCAARSDNG